MPGAVIVADQPSGAGSGVPGTARQDLWLDQQIDLSIATSGNTAYQWELLDKPPGSAAALGTPTAATSSFTPDLVGTYRIRLVTNGGGAGNVMILVFRVRYNNVGALADRGWALPGLGEAGTDENNYNGNARGYDEVLRFIFADLLPVAGGLNVMQAAALVGQQRTVNFTGSVVVANDVGNNRVNISVPRYLELPLSVGSKSTQSATPGEVIGARQLNVTLLPAGTKTVTLVATLLSDAVGPDAYVELWNVSRGYLVTGAALNNTTATDKLLAQTFVSAALTIGTGAGHIRSDSNDEYELRLYRANGTITDYVSCTNCHLRVVYAS